MTTIKNKQNETKCCLNALFSFINSYQLFEKINNSFFKNLDLTSSQFEVIVALGTKQSLTCSQIGEITFITKGTLTGVLDRLIQKNLIKREDIPGDRRSYLISLTAEGKNVFSTTYPQYLDHIKLALKDFSNSDIEQLEQSCSKVQTAFNNFLTTTKTKGEKNEK